MFSIVIYFLLPFLFFFFFNDTATTEIYTLSLHDALPIFCFCLRHYRFMSGPAFFMVDRKSTRLNSSHHSISYAVFCLKKKKKDKKKGVRKEERNEKKSGRISE